MAHVRASLATVVVAALAAACSVAPVAPAAPRGTDARREPRPATAPTATPTRTDAPTIPAATPEVPDDAGLPPATWRSLPPGDEDPLFLGQATRIHGQRTMAVFSVTLGTRSSPPPDDSEWWVVDLELCLDPAADDPYPANEILAEILIDSDDGIWRPFRSGTPDPREVFDDPDATIAPGGCLRGPVLIPVQAGSTPTKVRLFSDASPRTWLLQEK